MWRYLDLPKGAKWFRYRVSINHPLGVNWHPLEGARNQTNSIEGMSPTQSETPQKKFYGLKL